jgi:hypothetical protein
MDFSAASDFSLQLYHGLAGLSASEARRVMIGAQSDRLPSDMR